MGLIYSQAPVGATHFIARVRSEAESLVTVANTDLALHGRHKTTLKFRIHVSPHAGLWWYCALRGAPLRYAHSPCIVSYQVASREIKAAPLLLQTRTSAILRVSPSGLILRLCGVYQWPVSLPGLCPRCNRLTRSSAALHTLAMKCVAPCGALVVLRAHYEGLRYAAYPRYVLCRP